MVMGVGFNWLKTNFSRSSELDGNLTKPDGISILPATKKRLVILHVLLEASVLRNRAFWPGFMCCRLLITGLNF